MKKTTKTKPMYEGAVTGAAGDITNAYRTAQPGLQAGADKFGGILDSVVNRFNQGDPTIQAGRNYTTDVLSGRYLSDGNPYLTQIIDQQGNDIANNISAGMGTRGQTGGSAQAGILARELAKNATGLRFANYNTERDRMGQAVSQIPGLVAAENGILDPAFQAYDAMQAPIRAAVGAGQGVGGLLSQYVKTSSKGSALGALGQIASLGAKAFAPGF